ncbi:putative glucan endo-1,3-beta-glucosidase A6 [Tasmannia lanceolata]|uniref:putative glucan endo-1,3-beta-glucosidase A6 n=1 Tax=Tasmannia lanceolata TaxID=3420 RepID=UPI0040629B48
MELGLVPLLLLSFISFSNAEISRTIGINYGQLGNNLPSPSQSIHLIKTLKIGRVKIYDSNPNILNHLSKTNLTVSIMVPKDAISSISSNQTLADQWVKTHIFPFYPQIKIRTILIGNEILSDFSNPQTWYDLVPAMRRIKKSLKTHKIRNIKIGTPLAMDALQISFPPSNGTFRPDISETVIKPMLHFLNRTKSFFFVDIYTYFAWASNPTTISLDYALLKRTNLTYADPGTGLTYTNLLDQQLDAVAHAMAKLGFPAIRLAIAETGWPSAGDFDQIGANIYNAATYNRNLARKMTTNPPVGTPARPGRFIPTYIFALFNENQKPGPGTERNWGLFYPNRTEVYEIDVTGKRLDTGYKQLPVPITNEPFKGKIWCVAAGSRNGSALEDAVMYACGQSSGTCEAIMPGKECHWPNSLVAHASYAFNSYWQQFRRVGGNCYFNGLAILTTEDPSYGSCKYQSATS